MYLNFYLNPTPNIFGTCFIIFGKLIASVIGGMKGDSWRTEVGAMCSCDSVIDCERQRRSMA